MLRKIIFPPCVSPQLFDFAIVRFFSSGDATGFLKTWIGRPFQLKLQTWKPAFPML